MPLTVTANVPTEIDVLATKLSAIHASRKTILIEVKTLLRRLAEDQPFKGSVLIWLAVDDEETSCRS